MLVLSRKKNQTIVIDGQIEIEILKIKGNKVVLGITAPKGMLILRGELVQGEVATDTMSSGATDNVVTDAAE